jgi:hypothetical protein
VQSLGNLEDRVNEEPITQLFRLGAVEPKHFLTKLLLHALREVVEETEEILKADKLREIIRSHHHFSKKELKFLEQSVICTHGESKVLEPLEYLLDKGLHTSLIEILDRELN